MHNTDKYEKNAFGFPSHNVDPRVKAGATWCRGWAEAIHSMYLRDMCGILYSQRSNFERLRAYGTGCQDPNIYKKIILGVDKAGNVLNEGWANVNFNNILSVAPKFKEVILGMFEDMEHDIVPQAIDEYAGDEKETIKWTLWAKREFATFLTQIERELGITTQQEAYLPESLQELELFAEMGGIKLKSEIAMQKIIGDNEAASGWQEIKRKMIEDGVDLGFMACKDYVDPVDCKVKTKYIDPARMVIQYSRTFNYDNSNYAAHYEDYTVAQLRQLTDIPEEQLEKMAYNWCGYNGNPLANQWYRYRNYNTLSGTYGYDNFRITVLESEWYSVDESYKTTRTTSVGTQLTFQSEYGKVHNSEKKKTNVTKVKMVYQCKWIVGTEYCFDYGHMTDIPRPEKGDCRYSYHVYKLPGEKSFTERVIPNYDEIQIAWCNLQNCNATAPPDGIIFEQGSLMNISLGGEKTVLPSDIIRMRRQNGHVIYKATTHTGRLTSMGKPIEALPGGMGKMAQDALMLIDVNLNYIAELLGIDRVSSISGKPQEQSATQTKLAVAATGNSLKPMYGGYLEIKKSLATNVCNRTQLLIKYQPDYYKSYAPIIGKASADLMKFVDDMAARKFGIYMEARPTQAMKQEILLAANEAMKVGKNGQPAIEYDDYIMIQSMLETGQVKYARAILAYKIRKKTREQAQREQANIQANTQASMAADNQKTVNEIRIIHEQANADIKVKAYEALFAAGPYEAEFIKNVAEKGVEFALAQAPGAPSAPAAA